MTNRELITAEKRVVDEKIIDLTSFIFSEQSDNMREEEAELMETQLRHMMSYSRCLRDRLETNWRSK